jgi:hypothetical protein
MTTTPSTKERAQDTAATAADESKHVAGVAKDEAAHVAAQAKEQARGLIDDAKSQVDEQSRTQRDRLVGTLQTFSDDLEQMASQGGRTGLATDIARQVASKTRDLSTHLDGREPAELLDEVRDFARRKPGVFLVSALAAGVVAGRLARGAKEANSRDTSTRTPYDSPRGTAAGAPLAGTGYPATGGTSAAPMPPGADPLADPLDPEVGGTGVLPPQREAGGRITP